MDEKNVESRVKEVSMAKWGWEFTVLNSAYQVGLRTGKFEQKLAKGKGVSYMHVWGQAEDQLEQRP